MKTERFSQASIDFIEKATRQKDKNWLDRNREAYEELLIRPMKELSKCVSKSLSRETPGYRFPRSFARLRRSADNAKTKGPFRDWVSLSVTRDSGSRYDSFPSLYFHIEKDEYFSAGGLYMPSAKQTKYIRAWIDYDSTELEDLLDDRTFKSVFKGLGTERTLKTKPRDYPLDHPKIELLKLSGWYVWRPYTKKQLFSKNFSDVLTTDWRQTLRLNAVLDRYTRKWPGEKTETKNTDNIRAPKVDWDAEF